MTSANATSDTVDPSQRNGHLAVDCPERVDVSTVGRPEQYIHGRCSPQPESAP